MASEKIRNQIDNIKGFFFIRYNTDRQVAETVVESEGLDIDQPLQLFYSRTVMFTYLIIIGVFLLVATVFAILEKDLVIFLFGGGLALFLSFLSLAKYLDKSPLLEIRKNGLQFRGDKMIPWDQIERIQFTVEGAGKSSYSQLCISLNYKDNADFERKIVLNRLNYLPKETSAIIFAFAKAADKVEQIEWKRDF